MGIGKRKLKSTLQIAQTECGLCCVKTILEAYDYQISLTELRQIKEPGRDGLGLQQIKGLFPNFKMEAKTYRIKDMQAFTVINYPIIAHWKGCHYVCVESYNEREVVIMDPSIGRMTISQVEFQKNFSNYIITVKPKKDFEIRQINNLSLWKKRYIWPSNMKDLYLKLALASAVLIGTTLAMPVLTQHIVDYGFDSTISFLSILGSLIIAAIIMTGTTFLRTQLSIKMICRFSEHLLSGAFMRVLSLPAKYFTVRSPGEIVYRINSLNRIQDILGTKLIQAFLDFICAIFILGYIFLISTLLGFVIFLFTLATLMFLIITQPFVSSATDVELYEGSRAQSIQLDAIVSINSVKLGGYVHSYKNDWKISFNKKLKALSRRMLIQQGIIGSVLAVIQVFLPLVILIISLYMVENNVITLGHAIAIQSVTSLLFSFVNSVFATLVDSLVAVRYIELAEDIFEYPTERSNGNLIEMPSGSITIEKLAFKYNSDSVLAVNNITLDGEFVKKHLYMSFINIVIAYHYLQILCHQKHLIRMLI